MKLTVSAKLIGSLATITVISIVVALFGLNGLGGLFDDTKKLEEESADLALISDLRSNTMEMTQHMTALVAGADPSFQRKEVRHHLGELGTITPKLHQQFPSGSPLGDALDQVSSGVDKLEQEFQSGRLNAAVGGVGRDAEIVRIIQIKESISEANDKLNELLTARVEETTSAARSAYSSTNTLQIVLTIIGILASIGLSAFLIRSIVPPIRRYNRFVEKVGTGDLSEEVEVRGKDDLADLGHALNAMVEQLRDVTRNLAADSQQVAGAAENILAAVSEQTASVSQQSASITETSTAVEQVRASAELASNRARGVAEQSRSSTEVGQRGAEAMNEISAGMVAIREKVQAIAHDINALSQHTGQIEEITRSVSDLADQSNLLALNATIEAARAGEQGKGFAVVADEVRNLAEQSKQATMQVQALLQEIQTATSAAVRDADAGRDVVNSAADQIEQAGVIIAQLVDANSQAAQAAQQIAASAAEQNVGMDQIAQAMTETQNATHQLVQGAEQSRTAAEQLSSVASQLRGIAEKFTF